jgi:hypothetical protein
MRIQPCTGDGRSAVSQGVICDDHGCHHAELEAIAGDRAHHAISWARRDGVGEHRRPDPVLELDQAQSIPAAARLTP